MLLELPCKLYTSKFFSTLSKNLMFLQSLQTLIFGIEFEFGYLNPLSDE